MKKNSIFSIKLTLFNFIFGSEPTDILVLGGSGYLVQVKIKYQIYKTTHFSYYQDDARN